MTVTVFIVVRYRWIIKRILGPYKGTPENNEDAVHTLEYLLGLDLYIQQFVYSF